MALSYRGDTWRLLFICAFIKIVTFANGQLVQSDFRYCCGISKCLLIEDTCSNLELMNGTGCYEKCLVNSTLNCKPADLSTLATEAYSCFEPFMQNLTDNPLKKICGQVYSLGTTAAPPFDISYPQCANNCSGWALARWIDPEAWATPLVQYILPAVIFSMTVPRRLRLAAPDKWFNFELNKVTNLPLAILSLLGAGAVVTFDTFIWICIITATAGPMIVSGLSEAVQDWKVVTNVSLVKRVEGKLRELDACEKIQLLTAVACGNLDLAVGSPQNTIHRILYPSNSQPQPQNIKSTRAILSALITSQYSFGQTVGAPVLFYLGSFLYSLATIYQSLGDNSTAHSLAFGMWWMVVPHTTIVAGCLLGNNNPSTIAGIIAHGQGQIADQNNQDQDETDLPARRLLTPLYDTKFESVTMWTRGSTKYKWISGTDAWREEWFRKKIAICIKGWCGIGTGAVILISIPCVLGGVVSWNTPRWGLGCRAMTFLIYACCQILLIIITVLKNVSEAAEMNGLETLWYILAFPAGLMALFLGVIGTLMQVIGVYSNCKCAFPITTWGKTDMQYCNVASDTQEDRDAAMYWKITGYCAIGIMAMTCYSGWWYQRYLRNKFLREVRRLRQDTAELPQV